MIDDRDPLLDACLEEAFGGASPPDLTARILAALNERSALSAGPLAAPPIAAAPVADVRKPASSRRLARSALVAGVCAAAALALAVGLLTLRRAGGPLPRLDDLAQQAPQIEATAPDSAPQAPSRPDREQLADAPAPIASEPSEPQPTPEVAPPALSPALAANAPPAPSPATLPEAAAAPDRRPENTPSETSLDDAEAIARIDALLRQRWSEEGVKPAPLASDGEWLRRLYVRLLGRIPSGEEASEFLQDRRDNKRQRWVERLLGEDRHREEYARNWSTIWGNALIGRTGGTRRDDLASREGLLHYLRQSLAANKPYHEMAYELISATGESRPGEAEYNGATNFLLASASLGDRATLATSRTAEVFLGVKLRCAQCHNHPFHDLDQKHFWEMNAFFRQMQPVKSGAGAGLVNHDFAGESGDMAEAEIYFERSNQQKVAAYPVFFLGNRAIERSGDLDQVDRRHELAQMIASCDELPLALVNRLWAHFFGYGFTRPIDDMGPGNPPSHPELLAALAQQFVDSGYDLKRLMRWIAGSEAFSLSSKISPGGADAPEAGQTPLFSRYYTRQLEPEQVYESLVTLCGEADRSGDPGERERAKSEWLGQFTMRLDTDEGEEAVLFNGAVPQALMMMNGPLAQRATSLEQDGVLRRIVQSRVSPAEKVERLYLAALTRRPARRELEAARRLLAASGDLSQGLQDLWWALLNSNEFILDH